MREKNHGFTLIEAVIVIAILSIVLGIFFTVYSSLEKTIEVNAAADRVVEVLRLAYSKTLASDSGFSYGVHFENNKYVVFKGNVYNPAANDNEIFELNGQIEIFDINLNGSGQNAVFNKITGYTDNYGTLQIRSMEDALNYAIIQIDRSGISGVKTGSGLSSSGSRIFDSRHTHFNLGWSMQNASALKFNFVNDAVVEMVSVGNYFNADKTKFDWEGEFIINGSSEFFETHTHSLDGSNTLLSLRRDRNFGKNNKEVVIYIVIGGIEKEIAHYDDDQYATVYKGADAVSMEIQ